MIKNYIKVTFRNLQKHKIFTFINVTGLAVGMACSLLIFLYVQDELSYDRYHENADRIYRLIVDKRLGGNVTHYAITAGPFGPMFRETFPEVEQFARFRGMGEKVLVEYKEKRLYEERFFFADSGVFDVFSFSLVEGDPRTALQFPYAVLITETTAQKYFGEENPIGKILTISERDYTVTGILKDVHQSSHFQFDGLTSFTTLKDIVSERDLTHPGHMSYYTYFLLSEGTNPIALQQKVSGHIERYYGSKVRDANTFIFQSLTDIHLYSNREGEIEANGSIANVYIFSVIALFILLIACINFMNLATARSMSRSKEVGVRKVLGAYRKQLILQFLGEALILSIIALIVSIVFVEAFLPVFGNLSGKVIQVDYLNNYSFLLLLIGIMFLVGILAGSYPAFFLSAFRPVEVLKGGGQQVGSFLKMFGQALLRKGLVTFQFAISIVLLASTLIVSDQLDYLLNKTLGFDKEQVVVVPLRGSETRRQVEAIKNEWLQQPGIIKVTASSGLPGESVSGIYYRPEQPGADEGLSMNTLFVDYDFLETLGIKLVSGRGFSRDFVNDKTGAFVINETAARQIGWDDPVGEKIVWPSSIIKGQGKIVKEGSVIGVVKDFHFASLHQPIEPLVLHIRPQSFRYISVRISPGNISQTMDNLRSLWKQFEAKNPFEYFFLDTHFDRQYKAEEQFKTLFGYFSLLAVFIACLGLFGLISFTAERRTKEIGVRKVLGASVSSIVFLLSKDYTKFIGLASVVAIPVSYFMMTNWLQRFAYRVDIGIWIYLTAGILILFIAWLTVGYQSIRAARANPVHALRYE